MTLAAGLTTTGFVAPTFAEIVADINGSVLSQINSGLNLAPDQPIGQLIGIFAEKLAEAYEVIATLYGSMDPNSAEGRLLVSLAALTGTLPQAATYSTVSVTLNLNAATTVTAGALAYVDGQPQNLWQLVNTITSVASGNYTATFRSVLPGPFAAPAHSLIHIQVVTPGWNSIDNPLDATVGQSADTDTTLRARRAAQLTGQGNGDIDAIRSHILAVLGVKAAIVTENTTAVPASDGSPGHSFHAVVWSGGVVTTVIKNLIAQAIWTTKPSGILSYSQGNTGIAIDAIGNPQTVGFDFAVELPVYIALTTSSPVALTTAQIAAVKLAISNFANGTVDANGNQVTPVGLNLGQNVIALALRAAAFDSGLVTDVPTFFLGFAPSPGGSANLTVLPTQIATVSVSHITVNGL